jgi:LCP family protein required for cell wall assembly
MAEAPHRHAVPASRENLRRDLSRRFRRALGLTALSTLLPGAGLTRTQSKRLGWALVGATVLALVCIGWFVATRGLVKTGLMFLGRPALLQAVAIGCLLAGVIWCASIVLTALRARPQWLDRTRSRMLAAFTAVMVLIVGGGSYKATEYALITHDTVNSLFKSGTSGGPALAEGADPWAKTARVNILLIGSDAGKTREGTRTDSMIVASVDTKTGRTVLIQLPRSLEKAPLAEDSPLRDRYPSGFFGEPDNSCSQGAHGCLLTNLWREAEFYEADNPGAYAGDPSPGRTESRRTIELVTGLTIDQEVILDLKGFEQLIDAMGGIELTVRGGGYDGQQPLPIGGHRDANGVLTGVHSYFTPGRQHLDGWHALWYARTRAADDDTHRQARQRCVVRAIVDQVNPAEMVTKYGDIARIAQDNIYTDIPASSLAAYVELVERIQSAKMTSLPLTPDNEIYAGNPDYERIRTLVQKAITPPKPKPKPTPTSTGTSTESGTETPTPTDTPTDTATTPAPTTSATEAAVDQDEC